MSESDMDTTPYCAVNDVKDRLLVKTTDTSYDTAITNAIVGASRTVDIFLKPYEVVPLSYTVPDPIIIVTADLAASIFKRRLVPSEVKIRGAMQPDMINDIDGTGWFALALKKLLDYIKNYYALAVSTNASNSVYNPELFKELFVKGILTLKEARAYMGNASATIKDVLNEIITRTETKTLTDTQILTKTETKALTDTEDITKTISLEENQEVTKVLSDTETLVKSTTQGITTNKIDTATATKALTETETITSTKYPTKRQKSFGFTSGRSSADDVGAGTGKDSED
jgi:hypothetical protein